MSNFQIPPEYGGPGRGGWTWAPDANERFQRENGFDPTTGAPTGPMPLPPADVALQWQAQHDRMVWQYRQNLMKSGLNYGKGALGLLQSFRPGGSAAIEAGQYNNLANIQLQRAGMTQPLDLLGDYRRHEMAMNRQQANRQAERQIAVQSAALVAQLVASFATGGAAGAGLGGAAAGLAQAIAGPSGQTGQVNPRPITSGGGYRTGDFGTDATFLNAPTTQQPYGGQQPMQGPPAPTGQSQQGGQQQGSQASLGQPGQLPGQQGSQIPFGQPGSQGGAAGGPGGQGAGAPGQGMGMGAPGMVGADGNFMPVAYAANAAMQAGSDPIQQLAISRGLAMDLDSDPVWRELSAGIDKRLQERLAA